MTEPQQNNPAVVDPTVIDPNALVQIRRVRKSFGAHQVLRDISLSVPAGTVTVLLGPCLLYTSRAAGVARRWLAG